jgi:hypothetical protein
LVCGGSVVILVAALFASKLPGLREHVRPIYVARGILPPLPEGVGSTAELFPSTKPPPG